MLKGASRVQIPPSPFLILTGLYRRPVRRRSVLVLLGYAAVSCGYVGWRLLPHPGRVLVGKSLSNDSDIFVWSFAWWPHAVLDWTNPFFSRAIYAPTGINLAQITSVPALAAAFSPVTLLYGPTASFNLASVVLPALAAWTAFLLCRAVSGSFWAGVFGGYLFGFSSYMLGHQFASHLNLTAVFLLPLVALALLRQLTGEISWRGLAWRLGLALAAQAYISTEVTVTLDAPREAELRLSYQVAGPGWTPSYRALLDTEGVNLQFTDDAIAEISSLAAQVNLTAENIGARRLHTILEKLLEEVSFDGPDLKKKTVKIDAAYVKKHLEGIVNDQDLSKYIL